METSLRENKTAKTCDSFYTRGTLILRNPHVAAEESTTDLAWVGCERSEIIRLCAPQSTQTMQNQTNTVTVTVAAILIIAITTRITVTVIRKTAQACQ